MNNCSTSRTKGCNAKGDAETTGTNARANPATPPERPAFEQPPSPARFGPHFPTPLTTRLWSSQVTVEDVDECALDPASPQGACPGCRPHCHEHARCENRVGTYACKCPRCMSGDGFVPFVPRKSGTTPAGYEGGTGCRDVCAPVITLIGVWVGCWRGDAGRRRGRAGRREDGRCPPAFVGWLVFGGCVVVWCRGCCGGQERKIRQAAQAGWQAGRQA